MELLGDSGSLFQANVLSPDALFFLLPRLNFRSGHVPSLDATVFYESVVTKQEPSVNAVFPSNLASSSNGSPTKNPLSRTSRIISLSSGMNCAADHVHCPILIKGKAGVFPRNTVGVNPIATGCEYHNHLGDEVHKLLKFLLSTLTFGYINHGSHVFNKVAGWARTAWPTT